MAMLLTHAKNDYLQSVRRKETNTDTARQQLLEVPKSDTHATIALNGRLVEFSRKGDGWIEEGVKVNKLLSLSGCAVITSETRVPEDAVSVYGGAHGNTYVYSHYE